MEVTTNSLAIWLLSSSDTEDRMLIMLDMAKCLIVVKFMLLSLSVHTTGKFWNEKYSKHVRYKISRVSICMRVSK